MFREIHFKLSCWKPSSNGQMDGWTDRWMDGWAERLKTKQIGIEIFSPVFLCAVHIFIHVGPVLQFRHPGCPFPAIFKQKCSFLERLCGKNTSPWKEKFQRVIVRSRVWVILHLTFDLWELLDRKWNLKTMNIEWKPFANCIFWFVFWVNQSSSFRVMANLFFLPFGSGDSDLWPLTFDLDLTKSIGILRFSVLLKLLEPLVLGTSGSWNLLVLLTV